MATYGILIRNNQLNRNGDVQYTDMIQSAETVMATYGTLIQTNPLNCNGDVQHTDTIQSAEP